MNSSPFLHSVTTGCALGSVGLMKRMGGLTAPNTVSVTGVVLVVMVSVSLIEAGTAPSPTGGITGAKLTVKVCDPPGGMVTCPAGEILKTPLVSACPSRVKVAALITSGWQPVLVMVKVFVGGLGLAVPRAGWRLNFNCVTPSCMTAFAGDVALAVNCTATCGLRGSSVCKSRHAVS